MKLRLLAVLGVGLLAAQMSAQDAPALKTQKDKTSYGIGVAMARNLKRQGVEIDRGILAKGLMDELSGAKLLMSDDDMRAIMTALQTDMRQKAEQATKVALEENKKKGDAFQAENKAKQGVITLPDGLQYKILKAGDGKKPTGDDTVECQYRGTLVDGTEFDSSYGVGKPVSFKVSQVIAGWQEALKIMPVGSKWQLVVPPQLAYGERGAGAIGPNSTLIFEVELVSIKAKS
jgi:FKBP-type peptidyl-prolyl cis-trans isomerase FklB